MRTKSILPHNLYDMPELREARWVFHDRRHAGEVLAEMLKPHCRRTDLVMAIPAGGVPVGLVISKNLKIPFDVAVVSKITLPWNTEAGYGAVTFDGTYRLNQSLILRLNLSETDIQKGIEQTTEKVERRLERIRGSRPFPDLSNRSIILVDDGLASGFTMKVATEAIRRAGARTIRIAVPTAHAESLQLIKGDADAIYCPNIRSGWHYAVADAYEEWTDVSETEMIQMIEAYSGHESCESKEADSDE
ncbi:MAG: phosphoribosyltransferase [Deltaproteobacteria bacterium]|nr:phosphoribosyltransferase [Deltaproteobacteria bacterium]MBW2152231.1 phosphoribosyltransferase [Deltaproteobacteria bacterium]